MHLNLLINKYIDQYVYVNVDVFVNYYKNWKGVISMAQESKEKLEEINQGSDGEEKQKKNKIEIKPKSPQKKQHLTFEEKYKRFTTYLENELYDRIHDLKDERYIRTFTELVNNAIQKYLEENF